MNIWSSASAVDVAGLEAQVTAHNIANWSTPGFKPSRVVLGDVPERGGVKAQGVYMRDRSDYSLPEMETQVPYEQTEQIQDRVIGSEVSLEREMVELANLPHFLAANTAAISTWDQMTGTLLDMVA